MLSSAYVELSLARHAAPCLAGIKPANLVSFPEADVRWCTAYNDALNTQGVYFTPLCVCMNRAQILVYRKDLLARFCFEPRAKAVLRSFGYQVQAGLDASITHLKARMAFFAGARNCHNSQNFPHEIGFFLGYPMGDVVQYIKMNGRGSLLCGYWKVYSEPKRALEIFNRYTECKEHFALQIKRGMTISEIVCAA